MVWFITLLLRALLLDELEPASLPGCNSKIVFKDWN
jgi:hypothetical protein